MKPVLRTVVDKNGGEETVFTPTARMILYSIHKARNQHLPDDEVCALASIEPQLPARWRAKYGSYFSSWLEESVEIESGDDALVLERFGMMQALQPGNFQYFREMARTKGVIKEEPKQQSLTINTDFTAILALSGGNLDAARAKLLEATQGLVNPGGSGVASAPLEQWAGSSGGEGDRARDVQGEPVAVVNPLGANRGRAKQGAPVPAVPEQAAFASAYRVLDEGEVSPSSEESTNDSDMAF